MTTLASFKRSVQAGDDLRCIENTYIPERNGTTRRVLKAGPSVCDCEMDGKPYRMAWPKASEVLEVTEMRITYRLPRDLGTVTLERVAA